MSEFYRGHGPLKPIYTVSSVVFSQNGADKNGRGIVERW